MEYHSFRSMVASLRVFNAWLFQKLTNSQRLVKCGRLAGVLFLRMDVGKPSKSQKIAECGRLVGVLFLHMGIPLHGFWKLG
jgi:hypothetical protein